MKISHVLFSINEKIFALTKKACDKTDRQTLRSTGTVRDERTVVSSCAREATETSYVETSFVYLISSSKAFVGVS